MTRRVLVAALAVGLMLAGCKCGEKQPAPAAPAPTSQAPQEDRVRLNPEMVEKYVTLEKAYLDPYRAALEDWKPRRGGERDGQRA